MLETAPGFEPGITVLQGGMTRMSNLLRLLYLVRCRGAVDCRFHGPRRTFILMMGRSERRPHTTVLRGVFFLMMRSTGESFVPKVPMES